MTATLEQAWDHLVATAAEEGTPIETAALIESGAGGRRLTGVPAPREAQVVIWHDDGTVTVHTRSWR